MGIGKVTGNNEKSNLRKCKNEENIIYFKEDNIEVLEGNITHSINIVTF